MWRAALLASPLGAEAIDSVSPTQLPAPWDTPVTIRGSGFSNNVTTALIGNKELMNLHVENDRVLHGLAPALAAGESPGPRNVTVKNSRTGASDVLRGGVTYVSCVVTQQFRLGFAAPVPLAGENEVTGLLEVEPDHLCEGAQGWSVSSRSKRAATRRASRRTGRMRVTCSRTD
jgi:hypothetical protein